MTTEADTLRDLYRLLARAEAVRLKLRGRTRAAPGDVPVALTSLYKSSDLLGYKDYAPGDPTRELVIRELVIRDRLVVRVFRPLSEVVVNVQLDPGLLADPAVGPFAVRFAALLAATGLRRRQPTSVGMFGHPPAGRPADRVTAGGGLLAVLAAARPVKLDPAAAEAALAAELRRPRANTNLFVLTHVGYPPADLGRLLRAIAARVRRATVFPIVPASAFHPPPGPVADPFGPVMRVPVRDPAAHLTEYLNEAVRCGRRLGVAVEPVVVADPEADLDAVITQLALLP